MFRWAEVVCGQQTKEVLWDMKTPLEDRWAANIAAVYNNLDKV